MLPVLIIHGGAGAASPPDELQRRKQVMVRAVQACARQLQEGASALDAAIEAVVAMEDSPYFNAGFGSALNADGEVEMDASVMVGEPKPRAGAVAAVRRVKNPVLLARAVMERTKHVLIVGSGAERLAKEAGIKRCNPGELISSQSRVRWEKFRAQREKESSTAASSSKSCLKKEPSRSYGTVGAVALDLNGVLAAATSTGGITGKLRGRVGDSAIIGAGTFADPRGAASATGLGEAILKAGLCREAVRLLRRLPPDKAALCALDGLVKMTGGQAGIIMIDRQGRYAYAHNCQAMDVAGFAPDRGLYFLSAPPNYPKR